MKASYITIFGEVNVADLELVLMRGAIFFLSPANIGADQASNRKSL